MLWDCVIQCALDSGDSFKSIICVTLGILMPHHSQCALFFYILWEWPLLKQIVVHSISLDAITIVWCYGNKKEIVQERITSSLSCSKNSGSVIMTSGPSFSTLSSLTFASCHIILCAEVLSYDPTGLGDSVNTGSCPDTMWLCTISHNFVYTTKCCQDSSLSISSAHIIVWDMLYSCICSVHYWIVLSERYSFISKD